MADQLEDYVNVQEVARRVGRSTEQVRRYLREGQLEGRRIGGQWFIREQAVMYWTGAMEGRTMTSGRSSNNERSEAITPSGRMRIFERVNRRREAIRRRWETMSVRVDTVELIREMREER